MKRFSNALTRVATSSSHKAQKYQFEVVVRRAFNVLPRTGALYVTWKRGHRVVMTKASPVQQGECRWEESLGLVVTLYADPKTLKIDEKPSTFVVREVVGPKKERVYGEVIVNLASYAAEAGTTMDLKLPLRNGTRSLLTHLDFSVKACMCDGGMLHMEALGQNTHLVFDNASDASSSSTSGPCSQDPLQASDDGAGEVSTGEKMLRKPNRDGRNAVAPAADPGPEDPLGYLHDLMDDHNFQAFMDQPEPHIDEDPLDLQDCGSNAEERLPCNSGAAGRPAVPAADSNGNIAAEIRARTVESGLLDDEVGYAASKKMAALSSAMSLPSPAVREHAEPKEQKRRSSAGHTELASDLPPLTLWPSPETRGDPETEREDIQMLQLKLRVAESEAVEARVAERAVRSEMQETTGRHLAMIQQLQAELQEARLEVAGLRRELAAHQTSSPMPEPPSPTHALTDSDQLVCPPALEVSSSGRALIHTAGSPRPARSVSDQPPGEDGADVERHASHGIGQEAPAGPADVVLAEYGIPGKATKLPDPLLDARRMSNPLLDKAPVEMVEQRKASLLAHDCSRAPGRLRTLVATKAKSLMVADTVCFGDLQDDDSDGFGCSTSELRERIMELEQTNGELLLQLEEAQSAQAEMRDLEDLLIAARMKLADAEYERGLAMSKSNASISGT